MSASWQRNGSRRAVAMQLSAWRFKLSDWNRQLFASSPSLPPTIYVQSHSFILVPLLPRQVQSFFFVARRSPPFSFAFPLQQNPSAMFSRSAFSTLFLSIALVALADVTPTNPGPGQGCQAGAACPISWTPDTTGTWKTLNIELMTGDNNNMVHLTSSCCYIFRVIVV